MAQIGAEQLLVVAVGLAAAASLPREGQSLRIALALAGLGTLAWAIGRHHPGTAVAGGALLLANAGHLGLRLVAGRGPRGLTPEEEALRTHGFERVPARAFRQLLEQGVWINGRAGEMLLREGERVIQLFYLSRGEVRIESGGRLIATSGPGHFFGELDVLAHGDAIATIRLATDARFWCIGSAALEGFLRVNPEFRPALELALASELREKLRDRSLRLAGGGDLPLDQRRSS